VNLSFLTLSFPFDGAELFQNGAINRLGGVRVTSNFLNGITFSTDLFFDEVNDGTGPLADFETFNFNSSVLTSITFSSLIGTGEGPDFALDNIS
jgi:hypothetical protein